ncbi:MAG: hypothetical protein GY861_00630 [bacterium]|nr:hypothetical protein [bacterium]
MRNIVIVCVFVVLVVGCLPGGGGSTEGDSIKGERGITLSLVPNSLPSKIYGDGNDLHIAVELQNDGSGTVGNGKLYISGFDDSIITGVDREKTISNLEGRSMYNPIGDFEMITFDGTAKLAGKDFDTYSPTFLITACYGYETVASTQVCIDGDPFSISNSEKTCKPNDKTLSGGQGAPIAVTGVDVFAMKGNTRFVIHIENVGNGVVYDKSSRGCNPYSEGIDYEDLDIVTFDDVQLSGRSIKSSCKLDNGKMRLVGGKRYVYCETNTENTPAFTTPLTVKLSYGYRNSISKSVEILKSP